MKFKKLICMGMAITLMCSHLPQITVQAQQIQEETIRDIQSEEGEIEQAEEVISQLNDLTNGTSPVITKAQMLIYRKKNKC